MLGFIKKFLWFRASLLIIYFLCGCLAVAWTEEVPLNQVYADEFLAWLKMNRDEASGMPFSHVGDARFQGWTITYDAAVVAMAYLASHETALAKKILDGYINTPGLWRLGGVIEAFKAGENVQGQDWSVRSGANLWLANAAIRCYQETGDEKYLSLARKIADVVLTWQERDTASSNFGGVALGPAGDPVFPADQHLGYDLNMPEFRHIYATEVSLDAYAVFALLGRVTDEMKYKEAARLCLHWIAGHALNKGEHRFNRGDQDSVVATDVQSWGISALGLDGLEALEPGLAENMVLFVEKYCLSAVVYDRPDGRRLRVKGVDFTDKKRAATLGRTPLVSFEWSFQLVNAYAVLEKAFHQKKNSGRAIKYGLKKQRLLAQLLRAASVREVGLAYPYATQANAVIGHEYRTPAAGNFSAIGGAYAILAVKGYDPLSAEK